MFSFFPVTKGGRQAPAPAPEQVDEEEDEEEEEEEAVPGTSATPPVPRVWKAEDISVTPLPEYEHRGVSVIESPFSYFVRCFDMELVEHIVYQTNLYARQTNLRTPFKTDNQEMLVFIGILLYMGIVHLPAIEDYWALETRVPQVADYMSSKRFRLMRARLHFNDNTQAVGTQDRYFKVRPLINSITKNFLAIPETPQQSIDEVIVAYKGKRAGNLRQYMKDKPDKWGYKFFCRASIDGIIHDILMYQGQTTFVAHPVQLQEEEQTMNNTSKFILVLVNTMKQQHKKAVYADNYFTSLTLVEHLKKNYNCRYVGTARENRTGKPELMSTVEMNKPKTKRGTMDYKSCDGVLALKWKDNKVVNMLSTDAGIEPVTTVKRYDKEARAKVDVECPDVIKQYNGRMGGIDKSDMLTHLYKTPFRSRRWPQKIFGYVLDVCVANAWLVYKRDMKHLGEKPMSLKNFRLKIACFCRSNKSARVPLHTRQSAPHQQSPSGPSPSGSSPSGSSDNDITGSVVALPLRGQRSKVVPQAVRDDRTIAHVPVFTPMRQTCKRCSTSKEIHRSKWMCNVCNVALCLSDTRNCFAAHHSVNL